MKILAPAGAAVVLLAAPAAAVGAGVEPVTLTRSIVSDGYAKLRRYCDQAGRCWTEGYRNPLIDAYALAPPKVRVVAKPDSAKVAKAGRSFRDAHARIR